MSVIEPRPEPQAAATEAPLSEVLRRRRAPRVGGLMLLWCVWLLGSWLAVMQAVYGRWAPTPPPGSLVPAGRWMVIQGLVGLLIAWPMARLTGVGGTELIEGWESETFGGWWARTGWVVRDWFYLNVLHAAVLTSVKFGSRWTGEQTLLVAGWCAAWSLGAGVVVAWGLGGGARRRTWAMAGCVGVALGGSVLAVLFGGGSEMAAEPWRTAWALADKWPPGPTTWARWEVGVAAGTAVGAWVAASVAGHFQRAGARM